MNPTPYERGRIEFLNNQQLDPRSNAIPAPSPVNSAHEKRIKELEDQVAILRTLVERLQRDVDSHTKWVQM